MMNRDERSPLACLYHWEKTRPDAVHFTQPVGGGRVVEYRWTEIMSQVRRMAAHLKSLDIPPHSQIAILGKNTAHWIMADWAIWMAGHVTVPLYPTLNAATVRYTLEHSESRLLFLGKLDDWGAMKSGVPSGMPQIRLPLSPLSEGETWDDIIEQTSPLQGQPDRDLDDLATIVYTSGSTGRPKGVMQSFRSFNIVGTLMRDVISVGPDDRMLSYLPLAHVAERLVVENQSTYHGFHVFFAESLETFVMDLRRARPTIFFSVPRLWIKFEQGVQAKLPKHKQKLLFALPFIGRSVKRSILAQLGLDHVRLAFTGAAPLPEETQAWYRSLGLSLFEAYGMSENMAYSHFTRPDSVRAGYVGQANPGVECRIGDGGEIMVKSPAQMLGYFKDLQQTQASYSPDGFFKTGDMGEIDERGRVRITGRVKDLFKTSKGKYVAPVPIENRLAAHPMIESVCVCGANLSATVALLVMSGDAGHASADSVTRARIEGELEQLVDKINATLDPHERLGHVVVVANPWTTENGLLTPTMKVRRGAVEERYESQIQRWICAEKRVVWEDG